jgi:hypothetical protein
MLKSMKNILAALAILAPLSAMADAPTPLGPNGGKFGNWMTATYGTGDAKICYAFTKPQISTPHLASRGLVMLTVTERQGSRDEISITPGYSYPQKAVVSLTLGKNKIPFYVQDNVAYTDSTSAALAGFAKQDMAMAASTGPKHKPVTDQFSLSGFSAAHAAIIRACP